MYRWLHNSAAPKWLKVILYALLTITCIYWVLLGAYKLLNMIRIILHWATHPSNFWTFVICILILVVGSLLVAQFFFNLDPFGKFIDWLVSLWNGFRNYMASLFGGA